MTEALNEFAGELAVAPQPVEFPDDEGSQEGHRLAGLLPGTGWRGLPDGGSGRSPTPNTDWYSRLVQKQISAS
jgi:hypothetical protein